jgi:hypothetical protein
MEGLVQGAVAVAARLSAPAPRAGRKVTSSGALDVSTGPEYNDDVHSEKKQEIV